MTAIADYSRFVLTSSFEILGALRSLASEQRLIHLRVPTGQASILTTLLHIDRKGETLVFDGSSDAALSKQIIAAQTLHFDASENGVRVSFKTGPAKAHTHEGRPALQLPVPQELIRVQRRENFRVSTPVNTPVLSAIPLPDGTVATLPLEDLSASGLGASDPDSQFPGAEGDIFPGCTLYLPDSGPVEITLKLVRIREFERAGKQLRSLGFAFEDLRGATLNRIQRYVSILERDKLARSRGFK